jgi:AcrR family transcriptional regulator
MRCRASSVDSARVASTRTRLPVDARREQLLEAGVALFATRSWEEVSIDEIAANAGISRGLLYHYFAGKREYYVASIEHAALCLAELEPDQSLPPEQQLRVGLERLFQSIERRPQLHAALRRVAPADEEVAAIVERDRQAFAELVLAGVPGGERSPLARATARAWLGSVQAAALHWLEHRDVPASELIEVLAHGLTGSMLAAAALDPTIELPTIPENLVPKPLAPRAGSR